METTGEPGGLGGLSRVVGYGTLIPEALDFQL